MKEINYTFSIGSNCDSTFFIRHHKLSKFSGPMDWVYVDFESALKNIDDSFKDYTNDLFYYHKDNNYSLLSSEEFDLHLHNKKNYSNIDEKLREISYNDFELHPNKPFVKDFYINQNFLPHEIDNSLVKWTHSCWFPHHDFKNGLDNNVLMNKINAFNKVYAESKDNILFIGFNKFEDINDAYYAIRKISSDYHKGFLGTDVFYIILAPTNTSPEIFKFDGITFFLKHFEGIYQFEEQDKLSEAYNYLKGIYNFEIFEKPNSINYLPTTSHAEKTLDTLKVPF